jgi:ABC-2 type transport system ATP-binding protein
MSTVIRLQQVSLRYRLAQQRVPSFKDYLIHALRGALTYRDLWALRDIDLSIGPGEVVGVIGRNGAGKSTLSKVISGVLKPTRGTIQVKGRVSPILELGTGLDPELTGLENIYLMALFRGHSRADVTARAESIADFSGLGEFIYSPVRNYSTGMTARLGFAIASAWIPEVLVLDEVLSVGDATFLNRCHQRLEEFRAAGTTVLLVSHSSMEILNHCTRCIWLDQGTLRADGSPREVVTLYAEYSGDSETLALTQQSGPG